MRRQEDNRSITTRILHVAAKVLIITALGMGLSSLLGDIGIPARVLGVLGALAATGTAVVVSDYAAAAERRRCEEEQRAIEVENQCVDAFVAERAASPHLSELEANQLPEGESRFVRLVDEQRQQPSWKRGGGRLG
jgi:hypothetical protein